MSVTHQEVLAVADLKTAAAVAVCGREVQVEVREIE